MAIFQFTLRLKIFYNVKLNKGNVIFSFIGINVINYHFSIKDGYIKITNKKNKNKYLSLEFNKEDFVNYANFQEILFRKIYFKRIGIFFNFGIKDSAFLTSSICGIVDVLSKIAFCILKTKKSEVILSLKIYPNFSANVLKIGFKAKISLSLYDLFWSYIEALINNKINLSRMKLGVNKNAR